jgi:8-oxo-dGTP pyrophosphatase MutT (NUDIX family)
MARKPQAQVEPDREPRLQAAALPWRLAGDGAVEVLLITSRETRRWVIPKGWPIKGLTPAQTAAREAFEEAGVQGGPSKKKLGVYQYEKRLTSGRTQQVHVTVYPLRVDIEFEVWPEVGQREKLWTAPAAAAELVGEPELAVILRAFAPP